MSRYRIVKLGLAAMVAFTAAVPAMSLERAPWLGSSIAKRDEGRNTNGPLFRRAKAALAAAGKANSASFRHFLAPNAELILVSFFRGKRVEFPLTADALRAAQNSCIGPFSFDEAESWVQLSLVCRADETSPLSKYYTFRNSPELSLTIDFQGNLIKRIEAREPFFGPGDLMLPKDAFKTMQQGR